MSENKQKPVQNQKVEVKKKPSLLGRKIEFEPTSPVGWYTVLFPQIHDESRDIGLWLDQSLDWLRKTAKMPYTWGLLHGVEKQDKEITSPVIYFKDRYDALQCSWRLSGTLQGE
jgi:hypothetical protein